MMRFLPLSHCPHTHIRSHRPRTWLDQHSSESVRLWLSEDDLMFFKGILGGVKVKGRLEMRSSERFLESPSREFR